MPRDGAVLPIRWKGDALAVLDQRELPARRKYLVCRDAASVASAIRGMALRGAPLIGCAAAYGYALAAKSLGRDSSRWRPSLRRAARVLRKARPTAVNLMHAVDRMGARAEEVLDGPKPSARSLAESLLSEAHAMLRREIDSNRRMAEFGAALLPRGSSVLTYCNTGTLAACGIGTALGVIRRAHELGRVRSVYACETRPYLQGSRLTLWELMNAGIPCSLITDNMAAHLMTREKIDAVIVGADRIAADGDVANKIGTYGLAVLARHHGIPFYVAAPSTTVDFKTPTGSRIPIEERSPDEVTSIRGVRIAPAGARARHPAFDVTPHRLVTAIITERGVVRPADSAHLRRVLRP